MTQVNNFLGFIAVFGMMLLVALVGLMLLGPALATEIDVAMPRRAESPEWLSGQYATVQPGLAIANHATKHGTETWDIYTMLLTEKCAASLTLCGGSEIEKLHVCIDPITGIVGAVLQFGDELTTGYWERDGSGYWKKRVGSEKWGVCQ